MVINRDFARRVCFSHGLFRVGLTVLCVLATLAPRSAIHVESSVVFQSPPTLRFRLDPSQSKFIAHGLRGGLLWFKGQEHLLAARKFSGEAQITPETIIPASLQLTVEAGSLEETGAAFTEQQKQIINKELREIVFEPEKYPEIVFRSSEVKGKSIANNQYDVKIKGNLTLHGVTRPIEIPAKVSLTGDDLRALGEFSIDRSDFKVKATSAVHGLVRVRNKVNSRSILSGMA
ncbi:MAG: YceI family protein, partial [Pyrinomonadaceae bacterium]